MHGFIPLVFAGQFQVAFIGGPWVEDGQEGLLDFFLPNFRSSGTEWIVDGEATTMEVTDEPQSALELWCFPLQSLDVPPPPPAREGRKWTVEHPT